uniref:Uncharacterized protein n=1 Tax=Romanomermis culicivorax TaxID=13658 RepID=A0A915HPJ4_ROMCU
MTLGKIDQHVTTDSNTLVQTIFFPRYTCNDQILCEALYFNQMDVTATKLGAGDRRRFNNTGAI